MEGTILDRKLMTARTGRVPFALATQADDADIRRLLRENPMPGKITLTLEREPNYFADAGLPGIENQTIIANEDGRVVCVGNCAIRKRFVNGQVHSVGYLGGLRLDAQVAGRFDILRRGYEFFRKLQADKPADFYFTSIAADNAPARKFLERGLPGMPAYEFIGEFVTALLPVKSFVPVSAGLKMDNLNFNELLECLDKHGRSYQFAACWSERELSALQSLSLKTDDFRTVRDGGGILACAALWDQRTFKQTVICGYVPWLAATRPVVNFAAGIVGTPRLPAVGSMLAHAFLSHFAVAPEKMDALHELVVKLCALAGGRGIEFLTLGFAANDPRLAMIRARFKRREYRSRIYIVRWPNMGGAASQLDGRVLQPELALL
jgi:hypothetical protein